MPLRGLSLVCKSMGPSKDITYHKHLQGYPNRIGLDYKEVYLGYLPILIMIMCFVGALKIPLQEESSDHHLLSLLP